jgi:valyl-tRNA synthetase
MSHFDLQRTGQESLCERWILHKLNTAATKVDECLEKRAFYEATEAIHAFWLYELCDVFIVS